MMSKLAIAALRYASNGTEIFPCRSKVPMTTHGVLDATSAVDRVRSWWRRWPDANIGGRPPESVVVVDIDPRSGGLESWLGLVAVHGDVVSRRAYSGREDGGFHLFVGHPGGPVIGSIAPGIDVKTHAGYTILPPSIHPATGRPYWWDNPTSPIVACPDWLADLLRRPDRASIDDEQQARRSHPCAGGDSIADWFNSASSWSSVLASHGWQRVRGDGDSDGSQWRHPTATSAWSATVRHGHLFVYTTNTVFEQTVAGAAHGYSRFRAHALLDHRGDMRVAARALRTARGAA